MDKEQFRELVLKTVEAFSEYNHSLYGEQVIQNELGWSGYMTPTELMENYRIRNLIFMVHTIPRFDEVIVYIVEDKNEQELFNWWAYCQGNKDIENVLDECYGMSFPYAMYRDIVDVLQFPGIEEW